MVPVARVPVPCRSGSMARRKVSFCRVVPAMASWMFRSSRTVNRGRGGVRDRGVEDGELCWMAR